MKRVVTYLLYAAAGVVLLLLLLFAFSQTAMFRDWLRDIVVERSRTIFNGELFIGSIEGNLYGEIVLRDAGLILWREPGVNDTVASFDRAGIFYDLPALLSESIVVHAIEIDGLRVRAREDADGSWNFEHLLAPTPDDDDEEAGAFTWSISLRSLLITGMSGRVSFLEKAAAVPGTLERLDLSASAEYGDGKGLLVMHELGILSREPEYRLRGCSFRAALDDGDLEVSELRLDTRENSFSGGFNMWNWGADSLGIVLRADTLQLAELETVTGIAGFSVHPSLELAATLAGGRIGFDVRLQDASQSIALHGHLDALSEGPVYGAVVDLTDVNVGHWLPDGNGLPPSVISGRIVVSDGREFVPERMRGNAVAELWDCTVEGWTFDALALEASIDAGDVSSSILAEGAFGSIQAEIDVRELFGRREYALSATCSHVDLAVLLDDTSLVSDLNCDIEGDGRNFDPETARAGLSLTMDSSSLAGYGIDRMSMTAGWNAGRLSVDTMNLAAMSTLVTARGEYDIGEGVDTRIDIRFTDLAPLSRELLEDTVRGEGRFTGRITGRPDSLTVSGESSWRRLAFGPVNVDSMFAPMSLTLDSDSLADAGLALKGWMNTKLVRADIGGVLLDSVSVSTDIDGTTVENSISLSANPDVDAEMKVRTRLEKEIRISVEEFTFRIGSEYVRKTEAPIIVTIDIDSGKTHVENLRLTGGGGFISVEGFLHTEGDSDIEIRAREFHAGKLIRMFDPSLDIHAELFVDLRLTGPLDHPKLDLELRADSLTYEGHALGRMNLRAGNRDTSFNWKLRVLLPQGDSLMSAGELSINPEGALGTDMLNRSGPVRATLKTTQLDLSKLLGEILPVDEFTGLLDCDLTLEGTMSDPVLLGSVVVDSASVKASQWGVDYSDVFLELEGGRDRIEVKTLKAKAGKGEVSVTGFIGQDVDLGGGDPGYASLKIKADRFEAMMSRTLEAVIDADVRVDVRGDSLDYEGSLTVLRSRYWIASTLEAMQGGGGRQDRPLLVEAMQRSDTLATRDTLKLALDSEKLQRPWKGSLHLSLPRNTWLQGPDLNMELEGEMDIGYRDNRPQLSGYVKVFRGTYYFLGKKFQVREGRIDFRKADEFNPPVQFDLEYSFRDASKQKSSLHILVTGPVMDPMIRYTFNEAPIEENDAVSYILFGRSLDELSHGQKSELGTTGVDMAGNMLAARLSSSVGDVLGLDVVELQGENNWQRTTFTAGKYLTNDLFVSYTRGPGEGDDDDVNFDTVILEYELLDFLFLQLTEGNSKETGVDVFFKWD